MVKGNSGKAARSRHNRRLIVVIICCLSIILLYELSGYGQQRRRRSNREGLRHFSIGGKNNGIGSTWRRIDTSKLTLEEKIDMIISGTVQLVNIKVGQGIYRSQEDDYDNVMGYFCSLNWSLHKYDPSKHPMFRDLTKASYCNEHSFTLDLKDAVRFIQQANENGTHPNSHTMTPKGFVFHESRCGSTLAANALAAMEPSHHRVYSESTPPIIALRTCGLGGKECPKGTAIALFRDVVYLMGRTNDAMERDLFFKIQSIGTKYIDIVLNAFPETPWIFIYRHPIHVMMSQLQMGPNRANCVHQLADVPKQKMEMIEEKGLTMSRLSPEDKCALHLSLLCESAIDALMSSPYGKPVNYEGIIENLIEITLPNHFELLMTNERKENILKVGSKYSKGRGGREKEWKDDNKKKEDAATPEVKRACGVFLDRSYEQLETYSLGLY